MAPSAAAARYVGFEPRAGAASLNGRKTGAGRAFARIWPGAATTAEREAPKQVALDLQKGAIRSCRAQSLPRQGDRGLAGLVQMKPDTHTENVDYFAGRLIANPFEGVDSSIPLQFEPATFTPNDPPGIYRIANMAHYRGLLLSVHFVTETWGTLEGSAVMVAPGIAITATHVIQDYKSLIVEKGLRTICIGYTPSGPQAWRVRHVTPVGTPDSGTDLTVLSLELASAIPPDRAFTQAVMTTQRPEIGEQIMVVGFRASNQHVPYDEYHAFDIVDGNIRYGSDT